MTHIELAVKVAVHAREDFGNGILALCLLAEHVFRARLGAKLDTGNTSALLSTVVLFLHHQIELVKSVGPCAVLLLVILQWLQEADHRHTTFMF